MTDLSDKKCVPCEGGIPPFTKEQIQEHLTMVDSWQAYEDEPTKYYLLKEFFYHLEHPHQQ